jgi:hypothetical protein
MGAPSCQEQQHIFMGLDLDSAFPTNRQECEKVESKCERKKLSEKLSHKFSPYLAVSRYPDMEKDMWERSGNGHRFAFAWLRNQICLLFMTSAILHCELLVRAELSDFLCLKFQAPKDMHPMHIVVVHIMKGKFLIDFSCP